MNKKYFQESVIVVCFSHMGHYFDRILLQSLLVSPWKFSLQFFRPFYRTSGTSPQVYLYDVGFPTVKPSSLIEPTIVNVVVLLAIWSSR